MSIKAGRIVYEVSAEGVAQVEQRIAQLGEKFSQIEQRNAKFSAAFSAALHKGDNGALTRSLKEQTAAANENLAAIRKLSNEAATLRARWQVTGKGATELTAKLKQVRQSALDMAKGFEVGSQEMRASSLVAAQATRTIAGIEGGITRLGIAEQTAAGLTQVLRGSLLALPGPLGTMGYGLTVTESGLANLAERAGISTGAMLALAGGIGAVVISAGALEARGLGQVNKFDEAVNVLTASGADVSNLDAQLRQVQESAGLAGQAFSRAELAGSLADTVKAGVDASDALKLLGASIDLASADGQNLNDSTALLLQNLRQFGLSSGSARQAADELAAAGLDAAGSAADLSTGLATVGPVAKEAGLDMAQTLAILVNLDNKGLSAATVGANGFRTVLTSLADPSAKARQAINGLGVSLEDAEGHARPVKDVLFDIKDALNQSGVSYDQTTKSIKGNSDALRTAAEIFRTRGVTSILALDDSLKTYTTDIENSTGKSKAFADQMQQGLPAAEQRLSKSLDDLSKDLATLTVGPLTDFINALDTVIDKWDTLLNGPGEAVKLQGQERLESFVKQFGPKYGAPLADLLDRINETSSKLAAAQKTLDSEQSGLIGKLVGWTPAGHSVIKQQAQAVADLKQQLQNLIDNYHKLAQAAAAAEKSGYAQLPLLPGATGGTSATGGLAQAIQQAKTLEAALKAAQAAHNPQAYDEAAQALRDFTDAEMQGKDQAALNARALADVQATLANVTSSAKNAGPHLKTLAELFTNLAAKGSDAQQKALAMGNSLQNQLQSVQTREQLVGSLIDTLLSAPYNLDPSSNKIEYLVERFKSLQQQAEELQKSIKGLVLSPEEAKQVTARSQHQNVLDSFLPGGADYVAAKASKNPDIWKIQRAYADAQRNIADSIRQGVLDSFLPGGADFAAAQAAKNPDVWAFQRTYTDAQRAIANAIRQGVIDSFLPGGADFVAAKASKNPNVWDIEDNYTRAIANSARALRQTVIDSFTTEQGADFVAAKAAKNPDVWNIEDAYNRAVANTAKALRQTIIDSFSSEQGADYVAARASKNPDVWSLVAEYNLVVASTAKALRQTVIDSFTGQGADVTAAEASKNPDVWKIQREYADAQRAVVDSIRQNILDSFFPGGADYAAALASKNPGVWDIEDAYNRGQAGLVKSIRQNILDSFLPGGADYVAALASQNPDVWRLEENYALGVRNTAKALRQTIVDSFTTEQGADVTAAKAARNPDVWELEREYADAQQSLARSIRQSVLDSFTTSQGADIAAVNQAAAENAAATKASLRNRVLTSFNIQGGADTFAIPPSVLKEYNGLFQQYLSLVGKAPSAIDAEITALKELEKKHAELSPKIEKLIGNLETLQGQEKTAGVLSSIASGASSLDDVLKALNDDAAATPDKILSILASTSNLSAAIADLIPGGQGVSAIIGAAGGLLGDLVSFFEDLFDPGGPVRRAIQQSLSESVTQGLEAGLWEGFQKADFSGVKKGIQQALIHTIIDSMVEAAVASGALGADMKAITADIQAGNWSALPPDVQKAVADARAAAARLEVTLPTLPGYGSEASPQTGSGASTFALPEATFKPAFDFSALPAGMPNISAASTFASATPAFANAVDRFDKAIEEFSDRAVKEFGEATQRLANEGITINTSSGQKASSGALTADGIRKAGS